VKANFLAMLRWAASGWPLPLGGATAPRAWVGVGNLVDLLHRLGSAEFGGSHIMHVADAEQSSVSDMLRLMRRLLGQPDRLWDVSATVAVRVMHLLGRRDLASKLYAPLEVDFSTTTRLVGWAPPNSQEAELKKVLAWFQT
jgi:UDP-glucose 4-epimerase